MYAILAISDDVTRHTTPTKSKKNQEQQEQQQEQSLFENDSLENIIISRLFT